MNQYAAVLLSLVVAPLAAWADPPGRVGRLSLAQGEVAVFAEADQGWQAARVNSHLTSENSLWTEPGARAEVRFGAAALRLGETTQLDILLLDDQAFRGHVVRGTLSARVFEFEPGDSYEVTTPEARFQLGGNGRYRIDADAERGESVLTVFTGNARLEVAGGFISVDTGRSVRVTGGARARYEFEPAQSTALDEWALDRDLRAEQREARRYVPSQMTGWEDLDDYGVWRHEPDYGAIWFPTRVEAGWAPYRYGRWTWVRPWGWAWVDDAPWGYAPFHYGRWIHIGDRWGWYPGRYTSRPVWAPALVGWIGQPGWSISISTGLSNVVGWYPLSPYDRYQPWYSTNVTYVNNVNRIVIVDRRDRDRRDGRRDGRRDDRRDNRDRGATVVPRDQFGGRRPVQNVYAPVGREVVAAQPVVAGTAVLPSRNEWRSRWKPEESARPLVGPRAPAGRDAVARPPSPSPRPQAQGSPASRPQVSAPARPARPIDTAPQMSRPFVVEPPAVRPQASQPAARPAVPAKPVPPAAPPSRVVRPATSEPAIRPSPSDVTPRARPVEPQGGDARVPQPGPRVMQPGPRVVQPGPRVVQPQPVPQAVQPQPSARPVPEPERPAGNVERPARPVQRPARTIDPGQGG